MTPPTKVRLLTTLSAALGVALGSVVALRACSVCVVIESTVLERNCACLRAALEAECAR